MMIIGLAICLPYFYFGWIPLFHISPDANLAANIVGLFLYLAGFAFTLWARRTIGRYWGISASLQVKLHKDHQLMETEPCSFLRHPMYFGWWISMLGLTLLYPVWAMLLLFVFSLISFYNRARREESALSPIFMKP